MADRSGEQFGDYRLIRKLGEGSFGEVYEAEHLYLQTRVAIKVLQEGISQAGRQALLDEACLMAPLQHSHIAQVLGYSEQEAIPYLVMQLGLGTLGDRYPRGMPLLLQTILPHVQQAAAGLQYAHDHQRIHLDIKPGNMLLGEEDQVLLADFGIALVLQKEKSYQTVYGAGAGTPAYGAPEQFVPGGHVSPASDQYALGTVVYEWLTGSRPFQGTPLAITAQKQFKPAPLLRDKVPTIPPAVELVVLTALEQDPDKRHPSVQAFATALEKASLTKRPVEISNVSVPLAPPGTTPTVPTAPVLTPPQAKQRWGTKLLVSLAVLIVISGSLLGWSLAGKGTTASSSTNPKQATPKPALGTINEFVLPNQGGDPEGIATGPDGNLWFTEFYGNRIGRITSAGQIKEFIVPTPNSSPEGITAGPDGNLWFTEFYGNQIGRITPRGQIKEFPLPNPDSYPRGITAGPDGNLWFTESDGNQIGRITPRGGITEFSLPNANSDPSNPIGITAGPDGNLWFITECNYSSITSECTNDRIGRITPRGQINEFAVPTSGSHPGDITAGPDGNLWFTASISSKIASTECADELAKKEQADAS